jgi:hypothetical protein
VPQKKPIGTRIRDALFSHMTYHMTDMSRVVPGHSFDTKTSTFYLNSPAGLIRYRPKENLDRSRFRDVWVNGFDSLCQGYRDGKISKAAFFDFYRLLINTESRVVYKANLRTRLRLNCGI